MVNGKETFGVSTSWQSLKGHCMLTSLVTTVDGPRPPSDLDDEDADELAALAEDEAYWDALGDPDVPFEEDVGDPSGAGGIQHDDSNEAMEVC